MKICIDAFHLSFKRGTGLATHSRFLTLALQNLGHDVSQLFGLNLATTGSVLDQANFLQYLANRGDASRKTSLQLLTKALKYGPRYALGAPLSVDEFAIDDNLISAALRGKIIPGTRRYNKPLVFRAAQAYSLLHNKPLKLKLPQQVDVLHLTSPLTPIQVPGAKTITTILDIIPLVMPDVVETNLGHYKKLIEIAIRHSDIIFTISEHSKRDICNYFAVPENKVFVTYQAVEIPEMYKNLDVSSAASMVQKLIGVKAGEYFLFYGAIEPKKNVARIIEAMALAKTDYPLVIVGKDGWLHQDVQQLIAKNSNRSIIRFDYLPTSQLYALIKGARGLIFPSLYEGFGLPAIEAMQLGCPVITSNVSSLPEICGDAAAYVSPYDIFELASVIDKLASDDKHRNELIKKGYKQSSRFSLSHYERRLEQGYKL